MKGTKRVQNKKEALGPPQILPQGAECTTELQIDAWKIKEDSEGNYKSPENRTKSLENYS